MEKNKKIFMWVLFAVIAILIIYIIVTAKKQVGPPEKKRDPNALGTQSYNDATQAGIDTSVPPIPVTSGDLKLGDKLYSGEDILNAYKTCAPSTTNIANTFKKGEFIGTYVRTEGNCIVVSIDTHYTFVFGISISIGSTDNFLIYTAKVYKK